MCGAGGGDDCGTRHCSLALKGSWTGRGLSSGTQHLVTQGTPLWKLLPEESDWLLLMGSFYCAYFFSDKNVNTLYKVMGKRNKKGGHDRS